MGWLAEFCRRWMFLLRRGQFDREMDEEMRLHQELRAQANATLGAGPEETRHAARRQFGNSLLLREHCRDAWGFAWMDAILQDARFGLRQLRRSPGFTFAGVIVLALGIGAAVVIFSFVDAVLIKPLPYRDAARLVAVSEHSPRIARTNLSYLDYLDWKRRNTTFRSLEVWGGGGFLLKLPAGTQAAPGARVSGGFFRTLGVDPVLGRDFSSRDEAEGAARTVILSYGASQKWFGGDKSILGRLVSLNGADYTVIGVLPRDFQFAPRGAAELWTTLQPLDPCETRRSCHDLWGVGRLKDGVSVVTAQAELATIARALEVEYPDSNRGQGASVIGLSESIVGNVRPVLLTLLAGTGLLLLIAGINVASLLLARSESRKREICVRGALGASPGRLLRQFATESALLVLIAGGLGVLAAWWVTHLLGGWIPREMVSEMPYLQGIGLNFRALAFAGAVCALAVVALSVASSRHASSRIMFEGLAEGGRGSSGALWRRVGGKLVVVELAIAVVLLVGAGLLSKSLYHLLNVSLGFQPDHLATLSVAVPDSRYPKQEQIVALAGQIESRVASLPGVDSVGIASMLAASGNGDTWWIRVVGQPYNGEHNEVNMREVSADYFRTLRAPLVSGRYFTPADDASKTRVGIINQAFARKYFGSRDPIGKRIGDYLLSPRSIIQIVGVVADIREGTLEEEIWPALYVPFKQSPDDFFSVLARTSVAPQSIVPEMTTAIHQVDPDLGTLQPATMAARIRNSPGTYLRRLTAWVAGGFAGLAMLLGVVGLYGVIAYSVSRRYREFGIRAALGAGRRDLLRLVMGGGLALSVVGIAIGLAGAYGATRLLRSLLYQVNPTDPLTFVGVGVLLLSVALAACYAPARRAMRVDPNVALRYE